MILCGRDVSETKTLKTPNLVKLSMTVIVRAFTDVISCDPHQTPMKSFKEEKTEEQKGKIKLNSTGKQQSQSFCLSYHLTSPP